MERSELYHSGIKGMKWGVRRYQNKDGSLTPAGKKRRRSLGETIHDYKVNKKRKKSLEKARIARAEKQKSVAERAEKLKAGKIKPKDMTEAELYEAINKLNLEKRYKDLMSETRPPAKAVKEGKSFVSKMWDEAVKPAMAESTKQVLKNYLVDKGTKLTGLNKKDIGDPLSKLEKEAKKFEYQEKISRAKKNMTLDADYQWSRQEKLEKEARERAKKDAQKQVDEYNAQEAKNNERLKTESYRMKNDDIPFAQERAGRQRVSGLLETSTGDRTVESTEVSRYADAGRKLISEIIDSNGNTLLEMYDD